MDKEQAQKTPKVTPKSFMTAGPTLHYSHKNAQRCGLLAVVAFSLSCSFWSKILTGSFWSISLDSIISPEAWRLGQAVISPISIFEYPWQILVLGTFMGILAIVPILVSQLLSFRYSLAFIVAVFLFANLPILSLCLLISCIAVACRPLRFRSRFIAIALCTAPELLYWGILGRTPGVEPIKWGFSFTPWICAWLIGLTIAALVLGIGHFTRYRPGLVWAFTSVFLITGVITFETTIGFAELDYQLYVARNNPEEAVEFHDHSITEALDQTLTNPAVKKYLTGFFYPTEPIALRAELKNEIQIQLDQGRWPSWFIIPDELNFQAKRRWLLEQYDLFITQRPNSLRRMPIALYYKGLLSEYSPNINILGQKEILHFYSDYAHERSREIWYRLYRDFGDSPESLEARWRIARHWAGQGRFEQADKLLAEAQIMLGEQLKLSGKNKLPSDRFFNLFHSPSATPLAEFKLDELQRRIDQLRSLIGSQNRSDSPAENKYLARFVMLDQHSQYFAFELDELLKELKN
ncbi:MAG: tetratricopeptide repeat protein, partial [Planctomycetota bacterium]